jgi:Flp pilus assembly protein TadD
MAARALSDVAYQSGRYDEAARLLYGVASTAPEYSNLGNALEKTERDEEAEAAYREALSLDPSFAPTHLNLGNLLHKQQRHSDADEQYRAALALRSDYAKAWNGLGNSLQSQGRLKEALEAFRHAVQYDPGGTIYHSNLGTLLFALNQNAEALAELQLALTLDHDNALAHGNLGALLARSGCPMAAERASRAAISLAPDQHCWLTNLGVALFAQGRHAEAEEAYRAALAMRPDHASGHGNLLFALNYRTDLTAEAIFAEYQDWDRRHAKPLAVESQPFNLDRTRGRRLRVGYVSADSRQHAVAMFAEPLLAAHDRSSIELYLYAGVAAAKAERCGQLQDHATRGVFLDRASACARSRGGGLGHNKSPLLQERFPSAQAAYARKATTAVKHRCA